MNPLQDKTSRRILRLHKEGWQVNNIARITQQSAETVSKVLRFHGIEPVM